MSSLFLCPFLPSPLFSPAHRRRPQEKGVPGKWAEKTPTKRRGRKTLLECSHGVGDHESDFADHGVVELADVQAGLLFELVDAVD